MLQRVSVVGLVFCLSTLFMLPPDIASAISESVGADADLVPLEDYLAEAPTHSLAVNEKREANPVPASVEPDPEACDHIMDLLQTEDPSQQVPPGLAGLVEAAVERSMASLPESSGAVSCEELASWLERTDPDEMAASLRDSLSELRSRQGELQRAMKRLPRTAALAPGADRDALVTWAKERRAKYDPESPYVATDAEIQEVMDYLAGYGVEIDRADVIASSRFWYEGQSLEEKSREPITLTALAIAATIGAIHSLVLYYYDHKVHGEEFNCLGLVKAVYTGAVIGMIGLVLGPVKVAEAFFTLGELSEFCGILSDVLSTQFDLPYNLVWNGACSSATIAIDWINDLITDFVWATSAIRLPAVAACSAWESDELRRGGFSGVKAWVQNDLVPSIRDEYGLEFITVQGTIDAHVSGSGLTSEDLPSVSGEFDLTHQSTGRDLGLFLTNDIVDYSMTVQPNQPGSYSVRVKVFRAGVDMGAVVTRTYSTGVGYGGRSFSGSVNISQVFSQAGSVEGQHSFRIEVENTSESWTEWVEEEDGTPVEWTVEIRTNRKPSVSVDCATLLGLTSCAMFIVDPDNTRPQSLYLTVNGADENLTSQLPTSGVNWAEGYTLTKNETWAQGMYTVRARVSDGQFTTYSGDVRDLRVATLPYPVFPAVALTNVGEAHTYSVRWEDSIGGIAGKRIYLHTAQNGYFTDLSGNLIQSVVTGGDGWAYFDYTPMETGRHTLTVAVDDYELDQVSNYVSPGCEPPSRPYLDSPYNGEDELPTTIDLVWWTDDDASSYDVYFGDSYPPGMIDNVPYQVDDIYYQVSGLAPGEEYFWKIVARGACDPGQTTQSWDSHFFTLGAPEAPTLVKPSNGATDQPTGLVVDWANVTAPGTFLYELHIGDSNPPPLNEAMGTRTEKLFDGSSPANTLASNTTYYWYVIARSAEDPNLYSQSATWSFSTGAGSSQTVVIAAFKDASMRGGAFGNRNYGGDFNGAAEQKYYGAGNGDDFFLDPGDEPLKGAVQFDLASIPPGTDIINATLTLDPTQGSNLPGTTSDMYIDPFQASWAEMSITWNNRPSVDLSYRVTGAFPPSGWNPLDNDVTSLVQAWVDGTIPNHGLLFSIPAWESVANRYIMFNQRESRQDQSRAAKLSITYGVPCDQTDPPTLQAPSNGAGDVADSVTLDWADVAGASSYKVYFGPSSPPQFVGLVTESSYSVTGLSAGTTYHWMVEALADCDANVASPSDIWSFTTSSCLAPPAPAIASPLDGATGIGHLVTLSWSPAAGTGSYEVYAGTSNPPATMVAHTATTSAPLYVLPGRTYYWFVRAVADCDGSLTADSATAAFVTATAPTAAAGSDRVVETWQPTVLGASPSSAGGTPPYSYSWSVTPGGGWNISSTTAANPAFTGTTVGEYWCELTVTDSLGFDSVPSVVKVTVQDTPLFRDGFESSDTTAWSNTVP
jgi:hypothetical protein